MSFYDIYTPYLFDSRKQVSKKSGDKRIGKYSYMDMLKFYYSIQGTNFLKGLEGYTSIDEYAWFKGKRNCYLITNETLAQQLVDARYDLSMPEAINPPSKYFIISVPKNLQISGHRIPAFLVSWDTMKSRLFNNSAEVMRKIGDKTLLDALAPAITGC